jgi:uncharacterized protein involved in copper resistance
MTVLLTTPQSGGWVSRIGHGRSTEKPQERSARQMDQADADTMQIAKRKAQTDHSARKRKECLTDRAANEIVDLVEQEEQHPTSRTTGTRLSPDMLISAHPIATNSAERLEHTGHDEESIPEWAITESSDEP